MATQTATPLLKPFGVFVHEHRKKAELTLDELGKKLGVAKGYLSAIENAKVNPPSRKVLIKMGKILGCSPIVLMLLSVPIKAPVEIRKMLEEMVHEKLEHLKASGKTT